MIQHTLSIIKPEAVKSKTIGKSTYTRKSLEQWKKKNKDK